MKQRKVTKVLSGKVKITMFMKVRKDLDPPPENNNRKTNTVMAELENWA
jgi:hypothetical protein